MIEKQPVSNYLDNLIDLVRISVKSNELESCKNEVIKAMCLYPHSAIPHNLLGIILEYDNNHPLAMNHFRAAWSLDPLYLPARVNLESFGTFFSYGKCAYSESDCKEEKMPNYEKVLDEDGIYHYERVEKKDENKKTR